MLANYFDFNHEDVVIWAAVLSSLVVYAAGSRTCLGIIRNKTTGDVPLFPFIASLYSGVIWLKYSLLVHSVQYAFVNFINTLFQFAYIVIYHGYSKDKKRCNKILVIAFVLIYGVLLYAKYYPKEEVVQTLGYIGCVVTILMTGAPLVSMKVIIETQSTRVLDFGFISACFVANLLWTISGIFLKDINVSFPNGVGILLATFQLSLFVYYPSNKSNSPVNTTA